MSAKEITDFIDRIGKHLSVVRLQLEKRKEAEKKGDKKLVQESNRLILSAIQKAKNTSDIAKPIAEKVDTADAIKLRKLILRSYDRFVEIQGQLNQPSESSVGGGGGGGDGGGGGGGGIQKQVTFDCKKESERASRLGSIDFKKLIGMDREKNIFRLSMILPHSYPFMFPEGKGILLYGPPGTGKTFLAQAAAVEINKNIVHDYDRDFKKLPDRPLTYFYSLDASGLKGAYIGQTEKNIEAAFNCAQSTAEDSGTSAISILFFDEFEAIAGARGGNDLGLNTSVPALLTNLQGTTDRDRIRVIAATNLPDKLDEAITSRFPLKVFVDTPGFYARLTLIMTEIQRFYTKGIPLELPKINRGVVEALDIVHSDVKHSKEDITDRIVSINTLLQGYYESYIPDLKDERKFITTQFADMQKPIYSDNFQARNWLTKVQGIINREIGKIQPLITLGGNDDKGDSIDIKIDSFNAVVENNNAKNLLTKIATLTGMNATGRAKIVELIGKDRADRFLMMGGKYEDVGGNSEFGYSNRDINNLVFEAIRNASSRAVYQFNKEFNCYPEVPRDCNPLSDPGKCQKCDLTRAQRYSFRALKLRDEDFAEAFLRVPSSVDPSLYPRYIRYQFRQGTTVEDTGKIIGKEMARKNDNVTTFLRTYQLLKSDVREQPGIAFAFAQEGLQNIPVLSVEQLRMSIRESRISREAFNQLRRLVLINIGRPDVINAFSQIRDEDFSQ